MLWHSLLFEFLFECDFPLDHTNISKKSIRNTSLTGKSQQLKTWTLQDFLWWGTSLIWQQFASEPHLYQQDIANCISVNRTDTQAVGALLVEVRQRREPTPGHASWWGPASALRASSKEGKQRNRVAEVWRQQGGCGRGGEGGRSAVRMRGQSKQHLQCRATSKGKVGWTQMSEAERHVWKDQSILPRKRQGTTEIVQASVD